MPIANVFEALVALSQFCCVGMNVWFLHGTALGVTMTPEEAAGYMHALMLVSIIAMLLRFLSVMAPSPVEILQNTFFGSNALHCTAMARILIPAECSAVS